MGFPWWLDVLILGLFIYGVGLWLGWYDARLRKKWKDQ